MLVIMSDGVVRWLHTIAFKCVQSRNVYNLQKCLVVCIAVHRGHKMGRFSDDIFKQPKLST